MKYRDRAILRDIKTLKIGFGGVGATTKLDPDDTRHLIYDTLTRYNIPVEWTPASSSVNVDEPTLFVTSSLDTSTLRNNSVVHNLHITLELFEKIRLQRAQDTGWPLAVWREERALVFEGGLDLGAVRDEIKSLAEQFGLSFLSANR